MHLDELRTQLETFVTDQAGPDAVLSDLTEADGHAGLTFLFEIQAVNNGDHAGRYVLKLAPKGVTRRGNTDVYRQAPLLRALHGAGLPVPNIAWADERETNPWFGVPFIVMERLPGRVFFIWDPHPSFPRTAETAAPLWRQCVETLSRFHKLDWQRCLSTWEQPEPLHNNVSRWARIYRQAPEPAWIDIAEKVEELLLKTLPAGDPVGLFHGDYQPGNCLFHEGRLTGIVDWELAGISSQLLDIGWLMMAGDRANWVDEWHSIHPMPPAEMRDIYEAAMGRRFPDIPWFQAFAGYRLASIGCLNVKLHRKGQRHDPVWEQIGLTILPMYRRAYEILKELQT